MAQHTLREVAPHTPGMTPGTIIYTLDGALPIEYLTPGDRIITRAGMRLLRDVTVQNGSYSLHFDQPEVVYADGVETRAA